MSAGPNGGGAPPASETPLLLSDLRLEELVGEHDRIVNDIEAPDPLVEAFAAGPFTQKQSERNSGRNTGRRQSSAVRTPDGNSTDEIQDKEQWRPVKVGSLQELQAHLDHGRRQKELRDKRYYLLATMLREGMPLDVWVLTGDGRYVRLEQEKPAPETAEKPAKNSATDQTSKPGPQPAAGETGKTEETEHSDAPPEASPDESRGPGDPTPPPPSDEHQMEDLRGRKDVPSGTEETEAVADKRLLFYSVRQEALDGLPPGVPVEEIEQVSLRIERFEDLPRLRRFGLINYPLLALICLVAFWLISALFSAPTFLSFILLPPLACVVLLHFDSGLNGPRAIREHKRSLIESYGPRPGWNTYGLKPRASRKPR